MPTEILGRYNVSLIPPVPGRSARTVRVQKALQNYFDLPSTHLSQPEEIDTVRFDRV